MGAMIEASDNHLLKPNQFSTKRFIKRVEYLLLLMMALLTISAHVDATGCVTIVRNDGDESNITEGAIYYGKNGYVRLIDLPATVNIDDDDFQPIGTQLAFATVDASTVNQISDETIIYRCHKDVIGYAEFAYGMNAVEETGGGYYRSDTDNALVKAEYANGETNIFQSIVRQIGVRLSLADSGTYFSGYWQFYPISYDEDSTDSNYVLIRAKHLPRVNIELIKVGNELDVNTGPTNSVTVNSLLTSPTPGEIIGRTSGTRQSLAFITLVVNAPSATDQFNAAIKQASGNLIYNSISTSSSGVSDETYAVAYAINNMMRMSRTNSCVVENATPLVVFDPISISELNNGGDRQQSFEVDIKCNNNVTHGLGDFQTAMGFRMSAKQYNKALEIGLADAQEAVSHLISNEYGDAGIATGVGIRLLRTTVREESINFVGFDGLILPEQIAGTDGTNTAEATYTRADGGWFLINDNSIEDTSGTYVVYKHKFTAILEKLPSKTNETVTSGLVDATVNVVVQVL